MILYGRALAGCAALPVLLLAAAGGPGCTQDHDILGIDPPGTTGPGGGGAGGAGTGAGGEGGSVPVEPPGPTKLTVVNGVNDYNAIRVCFLAYPGGTGAGVSPWPSGAAGLAFAHGAAISIATVLPAGEDVRPVVVAGDLGAIVGLDCEQVLALAGSGGGGGPAAPIVAAALPVLPASVFDAERSLLLVPMGCMGGPGHTGPAEETACGIGYTPETPTIGLVAATMSRITEPGKVGLQVMHAAAAVPLVDVRVTPGASGATEAQVAPKLSLGAVGPFPPFVGFGAMDLGTLSQVAIRTYMPGDGTALSTVLMSEVLGNSSVVPADIVDGAGVVLVAVGSAPGLSTGGLWHGLTYGLVKADP